MKKSILFFSLAFFINVIQAQEAKFSVEVSTDSILLGNHFTVTFTLENASGTEFEAPSFEDFILVGGPNQSSSFSMFNGNVNQSLSFSYFLEPKDIGNYYIHPASIKLENRVLETSPLEIMVVPNPDGVIQKPENPKRLESDMFFEKAPKPKAPKKPKKKRKIYRL